MEVIIIDDGVNEEFAHINALKHNLEITKSLKIINRKDYDKSLYSHGSICACIIKKYSPNCKIGSIKILSSDEHNGSLEQLLVALEWCIDVGTNLINMSIGSIKYKDYEPVRVLISKLVNNGCIVVSACNNNKWFSVPACLSGVIGVETKETYSDDQFTYNNNYYDFSDIIASSQHLIHGYNKKVILTKLSNSYAAPLITSKIYNLLKNKEYKKICKIKLELYSKSCNEQFIEVCYSMRPDFIDSAIVLNYTEINNMDLLFFNTEFIYSHLDVKRFQLNDKMTNIVILPPKNNNDFNFLDDISDVIDRNKEWINGILYCGILPSRLKTLCIKDVNCLLWDEEAYLRRLKNKELSELPCGIPIISIQGDVDHTIRAMLLLEKELIKNEYNSMMVSTLKYSYLYGIEYIPLQLMDYKVFRYLETYFNLDIILFVDNSIKSEIFDLKIKIINGASNCFVTDGDTIIISNNMIEIKIKEIFNYIVAYFR
ncbi:MAG: hypothetical protein K0S76_878 [Herbinix sp.]|jgi:hypothetical protein|nr:hypothetical protein [Herbinix sp.]